MEAAKWVVCGAEGWGKRSRLEGWVGLGGGYGSDAARVSPEYPAKCCQMLAASVLSRVRRSTDVSPAVEFSHYSVASWVRRLCTLLFCVLE